MQLKRFHAFINTILEDENLCAPQPPDFFRFYEGKWYGRDSYEISNSSQLSELNAAYTGEKDYWRKKSQSASYIRVTQLQAYVKIYFTSPPREQTQQSYSSRIKQCYTNSTNAFDATHDGLTELLNRKGFEAIFHKAIETASSYVHGNTVGTKTGICLLALDIDHFKQLNDDYGHQYGDIVLKAFSWRLEEIVVRLKEDRRLKATVARMGGEEFLVLVDGISDQTESLEIANEIQQSLKKWVLPHQKQLDVIQKEIELSGLNLPRESERNVTASVGHTTYSRTVHSIDSVEIKRIAASLIREADKALYRAKTGGRDCVRSYKDIRYKLGLILEHHPETNIVAIDIGTDVGVQPGNEFLVYHPKFSGTQPFTHSDGRTVKTLGNYPRIPSGRITVLEAQKEISFCEIMESALTSPFPSGSQIEYIPLGSITHRVTRKGDFSELPILSEEEIKGALEKRIKENSEFAAITFGIPNLQEITVQSGIAHANRLLTSIYQSLQRHSTQQTLITTLDSGTTIDFIVLASDSNEAAVSKLMSLIIDEHKKVATCHAAACLSTTLRKMNIDLHSCFELARLSKQIANPISIFESETASHVVQSWRAQSHFHEAIADYKKFISYGIRDDNLENYAGLCFLMLSPADYPSSIDCFSMAHELDPQNSTYELNLAYAFAFAAQHEKAVEIFWKYHASFIDGTEGHSGYMAAYAYSAEKRHSQDPTKFGLANLKELLKVAIAQPEVCSYFSPEVVNHFKSLITTL